MRIKDVFFGNKNIQYLSGLLGSEMKIGSTVEARNACTKLIVVQMELVYKKNKDKIINADPKKILPKLNEKALNAAIKIYTQHMKQRQAGNDKKIKKPDKKKEPVGVYSNAPDAGYAPIVDGAGEYVTATGEVGQKMFFGNVNDQISTTSKSTSRDEIEKQVLMRKADYDAGSPSDRSMSAYGGMADNFNQRSLNNSRRPQEINFALDGGDTRGSITNHSMGMGRNGLTGPSNQSINNFNEMNGYDGLDADMGGFDNMAYENFNEMNGFGTDTINGVAGKTTNSTINNSVPQIRTGQKNNEKSNPDIEERMLQMEAERKMIYDNMLPASNVPTPNVPTPNVPTPNVPTPNVPTPNVPTPNVPTPNVPTPNVPTPNVPTPNVPTPNFPCQFQSDNMTGRSFIQQPVFSSSNHPPVRDTQSIIRSPIQISAHTTDTKQNFYTSNRGNIQLEELIKDQKIELATKIGMDPNSLINMGLEEIENLLKNTQISNKLTDDRIERKKEFLEILKKNTNINRIPSTDNKMQEHKSCKDTAAVTHDTTTHDNTTRCTKITSTDPDTIVRRRTGKNKKKHDIMIVCEKHTSPHSYNNYTVRLDHSIKHLKAVKLIGESDFPLLRPVIDKHNNIFMIKCNNSVYPIELEPADDYKITDIVDGVNQSLEEEDVPIIMKIDANNHIIIENTKKYIFTLDMTRRSMGPCMGFKKKMYTMKSKYTSEDPHLFLDQSYYMFISELSESMPVCEITSTGRVVQLLDQIIKNNTDKVIKTLSISYRNGKQMTDQLINFYEEPHKISFEFICDSDECIKNNNTN